MFTIEIPVSAEETIAFQQAFSAAADPAWDDRADRPEWLGPRMLDSLGEVVIDMVQLDRAGMPLEIVKALVGTRQVTFTGTREHFTYLVSLLLAGVALPPQCGHPGCAPDGDLVRAFVDRLAGAVQVADPDHAPINAVALVP